MKLTQHGSFLVWPNSSNEIEHSGFMELIKIGQVLRGDKITKEAGIGLI